MAKTHKKIISEAMTLLRARVKPENCIRDSETMRRISALGVAARRAKRDLAKKELS